MPYLKGPATVKKATETRGLSFVARAFAAAAKDKLHSLLGRAPVGYRLIAAKEPTDPTFTALMEVCTPLKLAHSAHGGMHPTQARSQRSPTA